MTDTPTDVVPAAHVTECVARSISKDGTRAMMVFRIEDGTRFAMTLPVAGLAAFRAMVNDVCDDAEKAQLGRGMVMMKRPHSVEIGSSDQIRGHVAVTINRDMPEEALYIMPDELGLNVADALQQNIMGRMTPADRAARMKRARPLMVPHKTIIVPGR